MIEHIREFNDGHGRMVRFGGVFGDKPSADKALAAYKNEYAGPYGTLGRVDAPENHIGLFVVVGLRYQSCD